MWKLIIAVVCLMISFCVWCALEVAGDYEKELENLKVDCMKKENQDGKVA